MDIDSRALRSRRYSWILFLFLLLPQPALAKGREPIPETPVRSVCVSAPSLADGWSFQRLFSPVQSALGNRRRMIQLATVGMCLGLYILMRK